MPHIKITNILRPRHSFLDAPPPQHLPHPQPQEKHALASSPAPRKLTHARHGYVHPSLIYDPHQMACFIRESCGYILNAYIPPAADPTFLHWLTYTLARIRPELNAILLGLSFYEHMMSSSGMRAHRCAAADSLLAVALLVAEKVLRDNPVADSCWAEVAGLSVEVLERLERAWCAEVGWRVQPWAWAGRLEVWVREWMEWVREEQEACVCF